MAGGTRITIAAAVLVLVGSPASPAGTHDPQPGLFGPALPQAADGSCLAADACRRGRAAPAPGDVVAANLNDGSVARFDGGTGAFAGYLVAPGAGGLAGATGVTFGPDGHLYVGSSRTNQVLRYDGRTGAFRDAFVDAGELAAPFSLIFGPDADLYVSSATRNEVLRFDGDTGAFLGIAAADSTLGTPIGLRFGPDGLLYVANAVGASVDRYDAATGSLVDRFATGVPFASDLDFGPDGDLYVSSAAAFAVLRFDRTGAFADTVVVLPDRGVPVGLAFAADGRLFIGDFTGGRLYVLEPGADEATLLASEGLDGPENLAVVPEGDSR
jgi:sugar lactone lactonase YvrE